MRRTLGTNLWLLGGMALISAGCHPADGPIQCDDLQPGKILQECLDTSVGKADRFDAENNPKLFGIELDYKIEELPTSGRVARMPWPDTYWPTYQDSVNARWQGIHSRSPLEKFDLAFNGWAPPAGFDDLVPFQVCGGEFDRELYEQLGPAAKFWSENHGNKSQRDNWDSFDCDELIEDWAGMCHAWVPASILEPEPARSVAYNGVTFEVADMKALMQMSYHYTISKFVGERCTQQKIERDEYGRVVDSQKQCRDTNPGAMHVILANLIGRDRRAFAEERVYDYEAWNQPVVGFSTEYNEISEEEATRHLIPDCDTNGGCTDYPFNERTSKFYEVNTDVEYITESVALARPLLPEIEDYLRTDSYHYILECTNRGRILGGEWLNRDLYPDTLWLPLRIGPTANPHAGIEKIRMLVRLSHEDDIQVDAFPYHGDLSIPGGDPVGIHPSVQVDKDIEIRELMVGVDVEHEYVGDLVLTLLHDGQEVVLQKNAGGDDKTLQTVYRIDGFTGSARGEWTLNVVDVRELESGTLHSWELVVVSGGTAPVPETFTNDARMEIPDNDEHGVSSSIEVAGGGPVKELTVHVDIEHSWISDLVVTLRHGTGVSTLHNREGNNDRDIRKTYHVTDFNTAAAEGTWTLQVVDRAKGDAGTLEGWSLAILR